MKQLSKPLFVLAILLIVLGILAVLFPAVVSTALIIFLGWIFLILGIVQMVNIVLARRMSHFWWFFILALSSLALGIVFLIFPVQGQQVLTLLLIAYFLVEGLFKFIVAFGFRHVRNWGWLLASGGLSLALAIIIWASYPFSALWVLGLLFGINLIFFGVSLFAIGRTFHGMARS